MSLSNTAVPIYYGQFRDAVLRGEIPVNREISMEMNRIDSLIANPNIYYDDEAVEGFRSAAALHPGYWVAHYYLGLSSRTGAITATRFLLCATQQKSATACGDMRVWDSFMGGLDSWSKPGKFWPNCSKQAANGTCRPFTLLPYTRASVKSIRRLHALNALLRSAIGK